MNAQEVIDTIHGTYSTGSKNGLSNITLLIKKLNEKYPVDDSVHRGKIVHVAGTNGKGSICAMLESVLRHSGFTTGMYTSPFLQHYQERIRFNGVPIDDEKLVKYGERVINASECLKKEGIFVTPFEMGTALAFTAFLWENVDVQIIEVGLGGRLDPTNIVNSDVCAIGAIGMDHMQYLGNTVEEIAGEKAGIIKNNIPVVCQQAEETVENVFAKAARQHNAPLYQLKAEQITDANIGPYGSSATFLLENHWKNVEISLPGGHQLSNAAVVIKVVEILRSQGMTIGENAVREGLKNTIWPGRLEWHGNMLIDGAHNAQGIAALLSFVKTQLAGKKKVLLTGVLSEKLHTEMLKSLIQLAPECVTVTPNTPRAMMAEDYASALRKEGMFAVSAQSVEDGIVMAKTLAGDDGIIIASGSLYFVGELRECLNLK